jgi:hypothetical protein
MGVESVNYTMFLDDERVPSDGLIAATDNLAVCRNFDDAVATVERLGLPEHICFDHDLGEGKTGHDLAKWLVDFAMGCPIPPVIKYSIHSQNPIGAANIKGVIDGYNNYINKENNNDI